MWNLLVESTDLLVESTLIVCSVYRMLEQMLETTSNYEKCLPGEQIIKNYLKISYRSFQ